MKTNAMKLLTVLTVVMVLALLLPACATRSTETSPSPTDTVAEVTEKSPDTTEVVAETVAETNWPERPIQNVIPFGAGGGTDVWNRAIMDAMSEVLGQTIVSSNMTGGSAGSIGINYVWNSKHDGYILAGTSETPLTIPIQTGLKQTSKDWEYFIAAGSPGVLCINKNVNKSFDEVITALKASPGSISIAGTQGGLWFALAKLFGAYGGLDFNWIAYDGSAPAIIGCVSGEADLVVASAGEVKEFVRSGDLIPLAVMNTEAWDFPEYGNVEAVTDKVPELAQYLPLQQFLGFKVPADTDPAIIAKLQDVFHGGMESEKIIEFAEEQLCVVFNLSGEAAKSMAQATESKLCWILYDMGQAKFSPEEFGIPKP